MVLICLYKRFRNSVPDPFSNPELRSAFCDFAQEFSVFLAKIACLRNAASRIILDVNSSQTTTVAPAIPSSAREKISPRIAAKRAQLSVWKIYRLYHAGLIQGERPTCRDGGILIFFDSLEEHLRATRDPEFWEVRR